VIAPLFQRLAGRETEGSGSSGLTAASDGKARVNQAGVAAF
jgi:hypothetical protein